MIQADDPEANMRRLQPRRKQFSSCDLCRKSRIACDASKLIDTQLHQMPGASSSSIAIMPAVRCTNCSKRSIDCTYEWIRTRVGRSRDIASVRHTRSRAVKRRALRSTTSTLFEPSESGVQQELTDGSETFHSVAFDLTETIQDSSMRQIYASSRIPPRIEALTLHSQLWKAFSQVFEPVLALWINPDCSPYRVSSHIPCKHITQLAAILDQRSCECWLARHSHDEAPHICIKDDPIINQALVAAVHAFSLRWLPLITNQTWNTKQLVVLGRHLWENARSKILQVLDRPSYKSVLALYLFGLTPTLPDSSENGALNGVIGEVSVDMALRQFHSLRVKRQDLKFSGASIASQEPGAAPDSLNVEARFDDSFIEAESAMYWSGVVFDTSASLTRGRPPILCSGVLGFEKEPVFRLVKARVQVFHVNTEDWRRNGFVPTDDSVLSIVQRASTWKGYVWKTIALLREAINYGHGDAVITRTQKLIVEALDQYDQTFEPLMHTCEKNILFMCKEAQLSWYLLKLHYNMGLLLLCNVVETLGERGLIPNFETLQRESVHAVFSVIGFGLTCHVPLDESSCEGNGGGLTSLISLDPYPHHVVAALELAVNVLLKYPNLGTVSLNAIYNPCRTAWKAMEELPQCSASLQSAKVDLDRKLRLLDIVLPHSDEFDQGISNSADRTDNVLNGDLGEVSASDICLSGVEALKETLFSPISELPHQRLLV
ncbi:hypothetical protein F5884DRAFT_83854 [Xylogone sp. PMI_703]|nr:hypothetical protein F5884DRAFT_83854 [Xylogone sp. PMI_703]